MIKIKNLRLSRKKADELVYKVKNRCPNCGNKSLKVSVHPTHNVMIVPAIICTNKNCNCQFYDEKNFMELVNNKEWQEVKEND